MLAGAGAAVAASPRITAIAPNNGPQAGGTAVTIIGTGFGPGASVSFGSTPAAHVEVLSPTSIVALSPAGAGTVAILVSSPAGGTPATPYDQFAYDTPPSGPWLGLDGNNSTYLGALDYYVQRGVVFDRSGPIDWNAGEPVQQDGRPTAGGKALARDLDNGMIPVVTIEYAGYHGQFKSDPRFPTEASGSHRLRAYVEGFVSCAKEMLQAYPGQRILFEPMNEPWGYTTPQFNGAQYAAAVARLLPAAQAAGIPLSDIYVGATGANLDASGNFTSGWITAIYKAQPQLRTEIQGWYLHPYGPPAGTEPHNSGGIESLPAIQAEMTSGQNNIIVSEVGYCAEDLNGGNPCGDPNYHTGAEAAAALSQVLEKALPYHEAGWLKALLVYSRNDRGWAMQLPGGRLTPAGEALDQFASLYALPWDRDQLAEPIGAEDADLSSVSCTAVQQCLAVGAYRARGSTTGSAALIASWNGERWSSQSLASPDGITLRSVSCAAQDRCAAVGWAKTTTLTMAPLVLQWNGSGLQSFTPPISSDATLSAISCSEAASCLAVGHQGRSPLALRLQNGRWSNLSPPMPPDARSGRLDGVSCVSPFDCTAVGALTAATEPASALIEHWNGTTWLPQTVPQLGGAAGTLTSISCASAVTCVAVGSLQTAAGLRQPLALSLGVLGWTQQSVTLPEGALAGSLSGMSCADASTCTAVGSYSTLTASKLALTEQWNGAEWSPHAPSSPPTTATALSGVACVASPDCVAVGSFQTAKGSRFALAEHGQALQPEG